MGHSSLSGGSFTHHGELNRPHNFFRRQRYDGNRLRDGDSPGWSVGERTFSVHELPSPGFHVRNFLLPSHQAAAEEGPEAQGASGHAEKGGPGRHSRRNARQGRGRGGENPRHRGFSRSKHH